MEETGTMRWVKLEPVMADTGLKVEINGSKVNVPGEDAIPATDTCELATDKKTAKVGLDCDGKPHLMPLSKQRNLKPANWRHSPE